jgi:threonine dehydrogenase-like Zn-dependent dehydrogenase
MRTGRAICHRERLPARSGARPSHRHDPIEVGHGAGTAGGGDRFSGGRSGASDSSTDGGIGVDRIIDAVGVDATRPHEGPASTQTQKQAPQFQQEVEQIAQKTNPHGDNWHPGDAPSLVLSWAVEALAKAGTLGIIGVYPETARTFPIGMAMNKNLTVKMGNCHHRRYIPMLIDLVRRGTIDPSKILTQTEPLTSAIEAYKAFDTRRPGWMKVKLEPVRAHARAS